jgi:hypothetical protein
MPQDSLFTFENLGTIGGASLLCFLVVAYTKGLIDSFAPWIPTNVYSLFVATTILVLVQLNTNPAALHLWQTYFLSLANGVLVSATASHTNELATRFPKLIRKKAEPLTDQTVELNKQTEETGA